MSHPERTIYRISVFPNQKCSVNSYVESLRSRIRELESSQGLTSATPAGEQSGLIEQPDHSPDIAEADGGTNANIDTGADAAANTESRPELTPADAHAQVSSNQTISMPKPAQIDAASSSPTPSTFIHPPAGSTGPRSQVPRPPQRPVLSYKSVSSAVADESADDSSGDDSCDAVETDTFVDGLDAMGVVHSATDDATGKPRRPSGYFGPSSTVSLLGDAFSAIKQRIYRYGSSPSGSWDSGAADLHDDVFHVPKFGGRQFVSAQGRDESRNKTNLPGMGYTVPMRAEADKLVDSYWVWVHSLYPFPHMPSFHARYRSIWQPAKDQQSNGGDFQSQNPTDYYDGVSEKLFHCMLNAIFALGALFNPAIALQDRDAVSRSFFNRAKALVDLDELACGSPTLVQVLLLMGQYLQSTDAASSCWNIVGLAIRVCQGIGLHHEPECCRGAMCTGGNHSQLDREIRRRTWTCSIILDR